MPRSLRDTALRYGLALLSVALALAARWLLEPRLGESLAVVPLLAAVAVAAWFGGTGPAVVTLVLGAVVAPPPAGLALFLLAGGAVVLVTDVTDRRAAERARHAADVTEARRAEQRTRAILESITDAFFTLDRAWHFTYVNRRAEDLLGRPGVALLGQDLWAEFAPLAGTPFERHFRRALAENETADFEAFYAPHGRWYEVHAYPSADGLAVYFRDATERRRLLDELETERRRLTAVIENVPAGIVLAEAPSGQVVLANPQVEEILRQPALTAADVVAPGAWVAYHADGRRVAPEEWTLARAIRGEARRGDEFLYQRGDGTRAWVRVSGAPIRDGSGRVIGGVVAFYDVDAEKRAEQTTRRLAETNARLYQELKEADRRKDEFLAMLAHELRNPLAPVRNGLHLLKLPGTTPAMAERARAMMERQVQHLIRLVDDLLDVSRIMRGKVELRRERTELTEVLRRALETAQPAIEARGHALESALPPEPVWLFADSTRLAQVVGNLLTNAAKYTPGAGRITLSAVRDGAEAIIRVRDTGVGIAPEMLDKVFDLFVQADRSIARSDGGLGIGLTVVRSLVEMHGGKVSVHSDGPGQGSEFVVRLPLPADGAPGPGGGGAVAGSAAHTPAPRRILVIDDNVDAAESLAMMLRLLRHEVHTAHDGPAGLDAARRSRPDVVLLDIGLPGMSGYEVAELLRREPGLAGTFLAAMTGYGQEEDRRRSREAGFDAHLVKPLDPAALEELLGGLPAAVSEPEA